MLRAVVRLSAAKGGFMADKLLRITEVAERLGLCVSTVRAWASQGRIAKVRVGRRAIRIPLSEVNRLVAEGTIPVKDGDRVRLRVSALHAEA